MRRQVKFGPTQTTQAQTNISSNRFKHGFTLVELLMVLLIIGILVGVVLPQFVDFSDDAKTAVTRDKLQQIKLAIIGDGSLKAHGRPVRPGFEYQNSAAPTALSALTTIGAYSTYNIFTKMGWNGPYVISTDTDWSKDGWGTTFSYSAAGRTLKSCGTDAMCGNANDISVTF